MGQRKKVENGKTARFFHCRLPSAGALAPRGSTFPHVHNLPLLVLNAPFTACAGSPRNHTEMNQIVKIKQQRRCSQMSYDSKGDGKCVLSFDKV